MDPTCAGPVKDEETRSILERISSAWRNRYEGSAAQDLAKRLGALDFFNWILIFGATLLLTVLPIILLLSSIASQRVDSDLARHLGLNREGSRIVAGLFTTAPVKFDSGIVLSLIIGLASAIAVAITVQIIYEKAFDQPHHRSVPNVLRCTVWAVAVAGLLIADGAISRELRGSPDRPVLSAVVGLVGLTLFFWWTMHFLLAGRESWGGLFRPALTTAVFWMGLAVFSHFYFSSTIISDSKLYGTIGVVFSLVTWFIAVGAVLMLGAVVGAVWDKRRNDRAQRRSAGPNIPTGRDDSQSVPMAS
jgi:membrane protein